MSRSFPIIALCLFAALAVGCRTDQPAAEAAAETEPQARTDSQADARPEAPAPAEPAALPERPIPRLVHAAGFDQWDRVHAIRFTFNVARGDGTSLQRRWQWRPKTDEIVYTGPMPESDEPASIAYQRGQVDDQTPLLRKIDQWFVNDSFWLLTPLHLQWADDIAVTDHGLADPWDVFDSLADPDPQLQPLELRRIEVRYPENGGGYTPGDAYNLFADPQSGLILAWTYHHKGGEDATLGTWWSDYRQVGPLKLSLMRHNETGFKLWFSDVVVRTAPDGPWHAAEAMR